MSEHFSGGKSPFMTYGGDDEMNNEGAIVLMNFVFILLILYLLYVLYDSSKKTYNYGMSKMCKKYNTSYMGSREPITVENIECQLSGGCY